ncbi:MAG: DUF1572 family protein [Bacteroidota bacterium]
MENLAHSTLISIQKLYAYYKALGERAMTQVPEAGLFWVPGPEGNSIAVLVKHLSGNMRSRFTDFLTTDGEKPDRNRDTEFVLDFGTREEMEELWDRGWRVVEDMFATLSGEDMDRVVYIRNEGHLVVEALHRQLGHYAYHVGQIVLIARTIVGDEWVSLSIPRGKSEEFFQKKMAQAKRRAHFTDQQ